MAHCGTLFIISSPSGAGKSSLIQALLARPSADGQLQVSVSHTTRGVRPGEENGIHYHFVSQNEFKVLIERGAFYEWAQVFDNYYGTSREWIDEQLAKGIDILLDIDWQGARQIREQSPSAKSIFILPPSREELERRLNARQQDSADVIRCRMDKAVSEMSHYNEYDYLLVNDNFDQALNRLSAIIEAERANTGKQAIRYQNLLSGLLAE
ncbi:guanylate kinase [Oceanisphaera pacifica]|uniref:Guanylate kinase n=1 Tax=Oceanisphaera pacifica TaxID=2818389 RepID=A0ABS3NHN3_9GAMM|nr:guanylate kinase [Oceanisphaera pacifica]MBO1519903.1 guanylate kinase [Oceanisphaera pacifica]